MIKKYATNIQWDTDGEDIKLPKKICIDSVVSIYDGTDEHDNIISDYITEKTGFCHFGFDVVFENK